MAANCQFAFAVHVLTLLAYKEGEVMTSSMLACSVNTNPVVIRRLLATLARAGLVTTGKGGASGSRLQRPPSEITLDEVFRVTAPAAISLHPQGPDERCHIGQNIEAVLTEILGSARSAFEEALAGYTLADVLRQIADSEKEIPRTVRLKRKTIGSG